MSAVGQLRAFVVIVAGLAALVVPSVGRAASTDTGPRPAQTTVALVKADRPTWRKIVWVTRSNICDARVTVNAPGVDVSYPSNTGTYTSFYQGAALGRGRADYTAFRVTADATDNLLVPMRVDISYVQLPAGALRPGQDPNGGNVPCEGTKESRGFTVKLPVVRA